MQHQNVDKQSKKLQVDMLSSIFATPLQELRYEQTTANMGGSMNSGITVVCQTNVGYHLSPDLTNAAALVSFWKHQLQERCKEVGIPTSILKCAQVKDLPQFVHQENDILQHLHKAWTAIRTA